MRRITASLLAVALGSVAIGGATQDADGLIIPPADWMQENATFGFDITLDGTAWLNIAEPGQKDDYAIRAVDLYEAWKSGATQPSFWVRGYHKRNPDVRYRESKSRFNLDCNRELMGTSVAAYYDDEGQQISTGPYVSLTYIIPGTYAAEYFRIFCKYGSIGKR